MTTITTTTYEYDDEGRLIKTVTTTEPQKPSYRLRVGDVPYTTWTGTTVKVTGE